MSRGARREERSATLRESSCRMYSQTLPSLLPSRATVHLSLPPNPGSSFAPVTLSSQHADTPVRRVVRGARRRSRGLYTTHLQELTQGYDFPWQESAEEVIGLQVTLQKQSCKMSAEMYEKLALGNY